MRVVIYTDILPKSEKDWHGKDWFIYEIIHCIAEAHSEHEFIIVSKESFDESPFHLENLKHVSLESSHSTKFSYYRLFNWKLPALLKEEKADALLSLNGFLPMKSKTPSCLVVQDISFIQTNLSKSDNGQRYLKKHFGEYLSNAGSIVTFSDYCWEKLVNTFKISNEKISVIRKGIHNDFRPLGWQEREEVKNKHTDGREYFIYAGNISGDKNIINMLKGFSVLKKRLRSNMVLILAGKEDRTYKEFPELMRSYHFRDDVKRLGYVPVSQMAKLVGAAYALISPSVMESYSSSVTEALRCKVPVLAAAGSVYEELAGEAALYFDPFIPDDIGDKFCQIYKDENLRAMLIAHTDEKSGQFNWNKTSDAIWNCMLQVVK
ncbi:MAG: glycosyltransferase family 1 protein [Chitinophagaceae bacterium]|nr:MAG: glycosyltransferase family 1 protein [Chitinophagaceae bacterium]